MGKKLYSTKGAAKKIGIFWTTLQRWIAAGKVRAPKLSDVAGVKVRLWSEAEIARVKRLLPKLYYRGKDKRRRQK